MNGYGLIHKRSYVVSVLISVVGFMIVILGCDTEPCVVEIHLDEAVLICHETEVQWAVPFCGNEIVETGETCDDTTFACDDTCSVVPGVSCSQNSECICDPNVYSQVPFVQGTTFYYHWISVNDPEEGAHHFNGENTALPGDEFAEYGEFGFDCDSGTTAPRIVIPPYTSHGFVALPASMITGEIVWSTELLKSASWRYYLPNEYLGRTLIVEDETAALYKVTVLDYQTSCLADVETDDQLSINYTYTGLWCPDDVNSQTI